ncbi:hypothetical protein JCM19046_3448 [Bacillus sp. JCM 19046]|nr:hypothetical protein JCM19045_4337 [Bacillus sp. JCM 19045]GAF18842.1 hypothetical protein JCM19046_3448 [Bacillus sp. JCM 19046]
MSTFSFALFLGAVTTGTRMGLGASIVSAGGDWFIVAIAFVLLSLLSAVVLYFIFNVINKRLIKSRT